MLRYLERHVCGRITYIVQKNLIPRLVHIPSILQYNITQKHISRLHADVAPAPISVIISKRLICKRHSRHFCFGVMEIHNYVSGHPAIQPCYIFKLVSVYKSVSGLSLVSLIDVVISRCNFCSRRIWQAYTSRGTRNDLILTDDCINALDV